jgi:hypothetical protein
VKWRQLELKVCASLYGPILIPETRLVTLGKTPGVLLKDPSMEKQPIFYPLAILTGEQLAVSWLWQTAETEWDEDAHGYFLLLNPEI